MQQHALSRIHCDCSDPSCKRIQLMAQAVPATYGMMSCMPLFTWACSLCVQVKQQLSDFKQRMEQQRQESMAEVQAMLSQPPAPLARQASPDVLASLQQGLKGLVAQHSSLPHSQGDLAAAMADDALYNPYAETQQPAAQDHPWQQASMPYAGDSQLRTAAVHLPASTQAAAPVQHYSRSKASSRRHSQARDTWQAEPVSSSHTGHPDAGRSSSSSGADSDDASDLASAAGSRQPAHTTRSRSSSMAHRASRTSAVPVDSTDSISTDLSEPPAATAAPALPPLRFPAASGTTRPPLPVPGLNLQPSRAAGPTTAASASASRRSSQADPPLAPRYRPEPSTDKQASTVSSRRSSRHQPTEDAPAAGLAEVRFRTRFIALYSC